MSIYNMTLKSYDRGLLEVISKNFMPRIMRRDTAFSASDCLSRWVHMIKPSEEIPGAFCHINVDKVKNLCYTKFTKELIF